MLVQAEAKIAAQRMEGSGDTIAARFTNAIFVGEPTGSSPNFVGEETIFTLPYSKVLANVSDLYWQSAWPMDYRTWIPITICSAAFRQPVR